MMVVLGFTACLIAQPLECEQRRFIWPVEEMSYLTCVYQGQAVLADWVMKNPRFKVTRHRCVLSEDLEIDV